MERFYEDLKDLLKLTPKKDVIFFRGNWNAKIGSQETPGVTGKFTFGVQNEAGQSLRKFCQENTLVKANSLFQEHKGRLCTYTSPKCPYRNQIEYILCPKDGETLCSHQQQDQELTVAQIMNILLPNSDLYSKK